MKRFVEGEDRAQVTLLPECLDDFVVADNPVRVIDVFIDELDLTGLGFEGVAPADTGRPSYHPSVLLKIYVYGYLNRLQSSRRLERETQRNVELMWLIGRLAPDFKTIADFRKDSGEAIRRVCRQFVELSRRLGLLDDAMVAIERASGSVSETCPSGASRSCCPICLRRCMCALTVATFSLSRETLLSVTRVGSRSARSSSAR